MKKAEPKTSPALLEQLFDRSTINVTSNGGGLCRLLDKISRCKIAHLFSRRHSFNLKGEDLFPPLYGKNYLFSNLAEQQIQGVA